MKDKKMLIAIIVLTIISVTSIGIIIYQNNNYVKIPQQYKCETNVEEIENIKSQQVIILNINKEQYIESYQNKNVTIYNDQELYDNMKTISDTENISYKFYDSTKTVVSEYSPDTIKDSEGNSINTWYKSYIINLENSGFKCQILK